MKSEPMSKKHMQESLLLILAIFLLLIVLDYLNCSNIYSTKNLNTIFYKVGDIIRALYFAMFCVVSWYFSKGKIVDEENLNKPLDTSKKITLIVTSFFSIAGLIFITIFPSNIIVYLYPILFIIGNFSAGVLILNYIHQIDDVKLDKTELGVDSFKSDKPFTIVLKANDPVLKTPGFININNPFRSALIFGGAGAGKSYSLIEPIMFEANKKNFSQFIYDFKFPTLAEHLYSSFIYNKNNNQKLFFISPVDVARSNRFNPLEPKFLLTSAYADEYAWTLYSNLDKEASKKGGFFPESASSLLKAVIWFMKKKHPEYCTLPHVINLILKADTDTLVKMLCSDEETAGMCKPVKEAADKKEAGAQLAGVVGSLTMQLGKINSPEVVWVLTGNEFTLDLNNPKNIKSLVIGNSPQIEQALAPILAFICNVALKIMNAPKKCPSMFIMDEAPSLTIPNIEKIPATARSNKLGILYCAQDKSQMNKYLGSESTEAIISNLAFQAFGQVNNLPTAKYASELFGKEYQMIKSLNRGLSNSDGGESTSQGFSYAEQYRDIFSPQVFINLKTGRFAGKTVENEEEGQEFWYADFMGVKDSYPDFKKVEIPEFVEDFMLTEDDLLLAKNNATILLNPNNISMLFENNDYESILLHHNDDISSKAFYNDLLELELEKVKETKKYNVLNANFQKIIDDVTDLALTYKDQSILKTLIKP